MTTIAQRIRQIPGGERWAVAGILLLTFMAFLPALKHPFLKIDDEILVVENDAIRALDSAHLRRIFTQTATNVYVPLTSLSFALEFQWSRGHPFVYHLDNVLLHVGVTWLVFLLARRWGLSLLASSVAALVFGLHPTRAEAVAWVSARKDVLYSFCYLLSLHLYQEYLDKQAAPAPAPRRKMKKVDRGTRSYCWSVVWAFLSVLAKPMAVSLPLVWLLVDWLNRRRFDKKILIEKIPFAAAVLPLAGVSLLLNRQTFFHFPPLGEGVLVWAWTVVFYLRQFFWPVGLNAAYAIPQPVSLWTGEYAGSFLALFAAAFVMVRFRRDRWLVFACLYYLLSIFFLLRFSDEGMTHPVADRYLYLPSLGLCLWAGALVQQIASRPHSRPAVWTCALLTILAALFDQTFQQVKVWGDDLRLWDQAVARSPGSFLAYHNRGSLFLDDGQYERALADLNRAIELRPNYAYAFENRGLVRYHQKEWDQALTDFQWALSLRPDLASVHNDRGLVYAAMNLAELALEDYTQALALNPQSVAAFHNRGQLLMKMRRHDEAEADFNRALGINPRFGKAYVSRGNLSLARGKMDLALEDYTQALALDPGYGGAYYNRSVVHYLRQDFYQARDDALMASQRGFPMPSGYLENIEKMLGVSSGVDHNTSQ